MAFIVPPGGFAGFSQMTPASRAALGRVGGNGNGKTKRRRKAKMARAASKRTRSAKRGRKMKFGSPAWQKKYKVGKFRK
jgi:hypothetical protein